MSSGKNTAAAWRQGIALSVTALLALVALIGIRGADSIGTQTANLAGSWLLSGSSLWHPLTLFSAPATLLNLIAGLRAWQNAHVAIAWFAIVCWLFTLPSKSWRGLLPVVPALIAAILSSVSSGLTGFGIAILLLSAWRALFINSRPILTTTSFVVSAWLAIWLSPASIILIIAALLETSTRLSRKPLALATLVTLITINFTPSGLSIWNHCILFVLYSPQATPNTVGTIALLACFPVLLLAARAAWHNKSLGTIAAPLFLFLSATQGQTVLLWPASLFMIPCWPEAKEQLSKLGFRIRWWMQTALLAAIILLVTWETYQSLPRWFNLGMNPATILPSLTRDSLPTDAPIYINPDGLPLARFAGPLPSGIASDSNNRRLAREPSLWRSDDRHKRYRAVWLLGDKSTYAALARHLGESVDWRLTAVDAAGILFERAPQNDEFATEPAQQFGRSMTGSVNRASFLASAALSTLAANATVEAGELSTSAVRRSDRASFAATSHALSLISLGQPREALAESLRAIDLDPRSPEVWRVHTEVLLNTGQTDSAYAASMRALELAPGDTGTLWLAARAANAARAFQSESEILEQLISLTTAHGGDPSFYQFYLGQSYSRQGLARPALNALESAAQAPGISATQRREIQEEIDSLKSSPDIR